MGIVNSLRYCFQMFLGHFNYIELRDVAPVSALIFFFSFQIIFKFFVINMGLAVIDKNFQKEDAERHKAEEIFKEYWKRANKQKDGKLGFYGRLKIWLRLSSAPVSPRAACNMKADAAKNIDIHDALSPQ